MSHEDEHEVPKRSPTPTQCRRPYGVAARKTPEDADGRAAWQIIIADVSMSLDNVLAVAARRASIRGAC